VPDELSDPRCNMDHQANPESIYGAKCVEYRQCRIIHHHKLNIEEEPSDGLEEKGVHPHEDEDECDSEVREGDGDGDEGAQCVAAEGEGEAHHDQREDDEGHHHHVDQYVLFVAVIG